MLISPNSHLYAYAITRDFGFAPNPFHGVCTLATCKPRIRTSANIDDWILGIGGAQLRTVQKKCIVLMKITEKVNFNDYWSDSRFSLKRPSRNGSHVQMLGDNIYHQDVDKTWIQEDSHHSNPDGTYNMKNLERDTKSKFVLISNHFYYFGNAAVEIDLQSIGYNKIRDYKKIDIAQSKGAIDIIESIHRNNKSKLNMIISDPCQFADFYKRVDQKSGLISK